MLDGLDLFSGIGGLSLALEPWVKPVAYCEIDRYAQAVLLSRQSDGQVQLAPIWDDVRSLRGDMLPPIDIIYGGFPCQDISVAGNGAGLEGERSGLVFEVFRLVDECKPAFVFLENVSAIRTRGGERVVKELASLGYDCRWDCLSAFDVGAPHKRERWWLLAANPERFQLRDQSGGRRRQDGQGQALFRDDGKAGTVADADDAQHGKVVAISERPSPQSARANWWAIEPDVGRVANGVSQRVERLRSLGNAVVPAQAREAFRRLMGL